MVSSPSPLSSSVRARLWPDASDLTAALDRFPIVAHGHVPWSPDFPRCYQTQSRLAERHPVLFFERPVFSSAETSDALRLRHPLPHLAVAQPVLAGEPVTAREAEARVREVLQRDGLAAQTPPAVHWFYRPDLVSRLDLFVEPLAVVEDCVEDDPACESPLGPAGIAPSADLVFAGSPDEFLDRNARHPGARLIEPGVDFDHFRAGASAPLPRDLGRIPPPRVGFAGVLDARVDFDLLQRLAAGRPALSLVLLGPTDGVSRERLPHGPNVFAIGPRPYEERPAFLEGFAAGLLPYRTDGAQSRFHPPEALEFLAMGRAVVSTPLPEVARRYADVVTIAEPDGFSAAVDAALSEDRRGAAERGVERARAAAWPRIVGEMEILVARAVQDRRRAASSSGRGAVSPAR
jgi:hypothetical protein